MSGLPSLVAFGSLITWPLADHMRQLSKDLQRHPVLNPLATAIRHLPEQWKDLLSRDPELHQVRGQAAAEQLARWVDGGEMAEVDDGQPNILTMPMTIITHIVQYFNYLDQSDGMITHSAILESVASSGGVQGFCTGLLSAIAVASGRNEHEIGYASAYAIRLAFSIGAYVELDERCAQSCSTFSSLAVRWRSPASLETVQQVLDKYPNGYISVVRDLQDVTITVPKIAILGVSQELSQNGVSVIPTGLSGRYHSLIHQEVPRKVLKACERYAITRFGDQSLVRSNTDGQVIPKEDATLIILQCILVDRANWYQAISLTASNLHSTDGRLFSLSIGADTIPQSISRSVKVVRAPAILSQYDNVHLPDMSGSNHTRKQSAKTMYPKGAIAIVGMSCKFPGADTLEGFWELLTSGTSMLEHMHEQRFSITGLSRSPDGNVRFWGNFLRNIDAFDHRFFKRSAREAAQMDPQQRLLLQAAYEAIESSGYFANPERSNDVGCYIGVCSTDYDSNVASHSPTAFSALGTLRAFLSGKISHHFGWSGPSVTFDTACSSSAVAIHTACKALQTGECSEAVAGGIAVFTSPYNYENLSAAHFLSPTGASKPFDAKADGYCRGEGVGLVVLKKLSAAMEDGDDILGVIGGSAVNQGTSNPITVPHASSQANLYKKVTEQAGISPHDVSFVEAHGTGTPVGDPIEMESIRRVFGGHLRRNPLFVSSVKGNIGHLEGASGVAALIKSILQMENRTACIQASFTSLNPKISPLGPDQITIPTSNQSLTGEFLTACINNYGAAGSNAAMILMEPPRKQLQQSGDDGASVTGLSKYPILLSAASPSSLLSYCRALQECVRKAQSSSESALEKRLLPNLAFNLAKHQNQELSHVLIFSSPDIHDLEKQLSKQSQEGNAIQPRPKRVPLVLCFGGQVNNCLALNKQLWKESSLFRSHLDNCDKILHSLGYGGIYPEIFQSEPVTNIVALHSMMFSIQYSSARAWLDSGLTVNALLGHSLGQITALCVSSVLSLRDGLKFVAGRATLMQKHWGTEAGSMIAVEADVEVISSIMNKVVATDPYSSLEIACYNGPTSHVVVGTESLVNEFELQSVERGLKCKRLNVTHGFHSQFTDSVIHPLQDLASSLVFNEAKIPVETCSDQCSWSHPTPELLANHTRAPVYFGQAVQRLENKLGTCTWLEAGSDSSVVGMVRRALDNTANHQHSFQSMQLNKLASLDLVVDATINLWRRGHSVQFWNFHRLQKQQYDIMRLPSYQFEKSRHWLELITANKPSAIPIVGTELPPTLINLLHKNSQGAEFRVDSRSEEYKVFVQGHAVLGSTLCPATLYIELASRAAKMIQNIGSTGLLSVQEFQIEHPLGLASDQSISIYLETQGTGWSFKVTSEQKGFNSSKSKAAVSHASGIINLQASGLTIAQELARYERLIGHEKIDALYRDKDSELIRGAMVYKVFSQTVEYAQYYRGVQSIAAKDNQIAGMIMMPEHTDAMKDTTTFPTLLDSFMQIAGLHANSIHECPENEVFVFTKLDRVQFGSEFVPCKDNNSKQQCWTVFALASSSPKDVANDIFVFDAGSKRLVMVILGARFTRIRRNTLTKLLLRANDSAANVMMEIPRNSEPSNLSQPVLVQERPQNISGSSNAATVSNYARSNNITAIFHDVCGLLERVAEVPRNEVRGDALLDDLGVDSLMMIEVIVEISSLYATELPITELESLTDIDSLTVYLDKRGCVGTKQGFDSSSSSTPISSNTSTATSPATTPSESMAATPSRTPSQKVVSDKLAKLVAEHLELETEVRSNTNLADHGLDSLLCIELANDIKNLFFIDIDMERLNSDSTFGDLLDLVVPGSSSDLEPLPTRTKSEVKSASKPTYHSQPEAIITESVPYQLADKEVSLSGVQQIFENVRFDFDKYSKETLFTDFWEKVYPQQAKLVLSYTVEAFQKLGCNLYSMDAGQQLPQVQVLPRHQRLLQQLHEILEDGNLIECQDDTTFMRTTTTIDLVPSATLLDEIIRKFPQHAVESRLLNVTASRLAECLLGEADPLQLLFVNKTNRQLLADVYDNAPETQAATLLLSNLLGDIFAASQNDGIFRILEVGAGTGGTARYLVDFLTRRGIKFEYTFTDISSALVSQAKKKFASYGSMKFMTLDCDRPAPKELIGRFHVVIATNCIHATKDATASASNIRPVLRPDGIFALVEFTRGIYWFDLVYGLLEGWWVFDDGRQHALADEWFWDKSIRAAGFKHVSWTDGVTKEAQTLRIICAFNSEAQKDIFKPIPRALTRRAGIEIETVAWKRVGELDLYADIYYPSSNGSCVKKRPIALLLHGGGHVLYSRKDIHMKHVKILLERGFLPVSVDYRLCPEVTITEGPMTDACDALKWARETLPSLKLSNPLLKINKEKLAAVGWSSGGQLAMTLGYTAVTKGIKPPNVVLAFYCPSDFEADHWKSPIYPKGAEEPPKDDYDILEGVRDEPITGHQPLNTRGVTGLFLTLKDARWRIILHMNWKAQLLPVLIKGLPSKSKVIEKNDHSTDWKALPIPSVEEIRAISPYAQILQGNYSTPTFMVHGSRDELIPWEQSQMVVDALKERGIKAGIEIVDAGHAFDLFPAEDFSEGRSWVSINKGYDFLCRQLSLPI